MKSLPTSLKFKLSQHETSEKWRVRILSKDSAFAYQLLEANEGVCAYSTLEIENPLYRDLELIVPTGMIEEMNQLLNELKDALAGELYEISRH
jgi:hypothetical protein